LLPGGAGIHYTFGLICPPDPNSNTDDDGMVRWEEFSDCGLTGEKGDGSYGRRHSFKGEKEEWQPGSLIQ